MPHEDQFTAVGPSLTGSGFPRAGFSTKASDMDHGVNVRGEKCGVYGESGVPLPSGRAPEVDGIGVHGFGTNFGVSGRATANGIAGIVGRHGNNGIGVIGAVKSEDLKGIGVVGVSRSPGLGSPTAPVPDPADGLGIGVFGTSGEGPGVRGSSQSGEGWTIRIGVKCRSEWNKWFGHRSLWQKSIGHWGDWQKCGKSRRPVQLS
jgi:hypothetical protein